MSLPPTPQPVEVFRGSLLKIRSGTLKIGGQVFPFIPPLMHWIKAFHIIFVIVWYAGLLYLPRLFVYHATTRDTIGDERFQVMEKRLFAIMSIGMIGTVTLGIWLLVAQSWSGGWILTKMTLVAGLIGFHFVCGKLMLSFRHQQNRHSQRFYRIINEIPALVLVAIVVLVVVKPF